MTAIQQVKTALTDAINAFGVRAVNAYSGEALKDYPAAVAAVGTHGGTITHSGALEYLGERCDASRGTVCEVYGRRLELTLAIDLYAPRALGAAGCEDAAEAVSQAMMTALPCGLRLQELVWGETQWDTACRMFRLSAQAKYEAYFTAEAAEETAVFTDFILRGVVQNHDQYST